jgi:hypothetical protein
MQLSDPELSIGVFARKSRLSMRALRLYEKMGVLKPSRSGSQVKKGAYVEAICSRSKAEMCQSNWY